MRWDSPLSCGCGLASRSQACGPIASGVCGSAAVCTTSSSVCATSSSVFTAASSVCSAASWSLSGRLRPFHLIRVRAQSWVTVHPNSVRLGASWRGVVYGEINGSTVKMEAATCRIRSSVLRLGRSAQCAKVV